MKRMLILTCVLALAACKVQKVGQDTYKVVAPTPQAKAQAEKAKADATRAAEKIKQEAAKAGEELKQATHNAQSRSETTETTQTTSTAATPETSTTETRRNVSRHH